MGDDRQSSTGRFRLWIDDACITACQCVLIDPELFGFDDDGVTVVLVDEVPGDKLPSASAAVDNCPIGAIHLDPTPHV
ncbi:MAG: ferredoxin [bacterium]|nr:ferredoxin [bacterium]MXV89329.1 ferredoxin [Acidimicrobiia bacterium]MYC45180.1 ferredoxin [Acidimicrobiia bacterium]MYI18564.1 ferredoxin [Acidimicrobiia bacterium]